MHRIGLALSGGGFRATLFHLGMVRFLREANILPAVTHITCVSGGSILGAHLALNWHRYTGSLEEFGTLTRLKEQPGKNPDAPGMLSALLTDHEAVIRALRADVETVGDLGDAGTNDFLTGLLEQHEKFAWMLRSYLR